MLIGENSESWVSQGDEDYGEGYIIGSSSKCQPTKLMRYLMDELFTQDKFRCNSVRGKKWLPALDEDTMNAILC